MVSNESSVEQEAVGQVEETPQFAPRPLEIGWIVAGRLDRVDLEAIRLARDEVLALLRRQFPEFEWRMPLLQRNEMVRSAREEPVRLFDAGANERDAAHWEFVLVITAADLISRYKPFSLATLSHSLDVGVISTFRIDPQAEDFEISRDDRVEVLARRLRALAMHILGHLGGLAHSEDPSNWMYNLRTVQDLEQMGEFSEEQVTSLGGNLREVADLRLEDYASFQQGTSFKFYLYGIWMNRGDILKASWEAKPWEFPIRLSRLTTAAIATMLLLINTAETWDLATVQPPGQIFLLSVLAIIATTVYVLIRQQLFVRRQPRQFSEQRVFANATIAAVVLMGMATTYAVIFLLTLLLEQLLYHPQLVASWATSLKTPPHLLHYLELAGFVSSLGLVIGAFGVSFEEQHYFQHVIFVDEET